MESFVEEDLEVVFIGVLPQEFKPGVTCEVLVLGVWAGDDVAVEPGFHLECFIGELEVVTKLGVCIPVTEEDPGIFT